MRSEGTGWRSALFCRVVVVVSFIGIGWSLIGHGPFGTRNSKLETRNSIIENRELASAHSAGGDAATRATAIRTFETRPLTFEANRGQTDRRVKFLSRGGGYALFLTGDEAVLTLGKTSQMANVEKTGVRSQEPEGREETRKSKMETRHLRAARDRGQRTRDSVLRMKLVNANPKAAVVGLDELVAKSNYFIGSDPAEWHTNVPNYAKVKYEGIYPGVDLVFYGNQRQLEYDFVVAPGADPSEIRLAIKNQKSEIRNQKSTQFKNQNAKCKIDASGDLVIPTGSGEVVFHKPVVYQEQSTVDSRELKVGRWRSAIENRQFLEGHYVLAADGAVRFEIPNYDRSKRLVIDPTLQYSSWLGGSNADTGNAIAVDSNSNAYVVGQTFSSDFPTSVPYQGTCKSCASGNGTAFVTAINASGEFVYSTFLGGNGTDSAAAVAVDSAGDAYVVGSTTSTRFPFTNGVFQTSCKSCAAGQPDAFVTELNPAGSALVFSTFLGGSQSDQATGVAVDSTGIYVTGTTFSSDFPTQNPLFPNCGGSGGTGCASASDAFVTKINVGGATLAYSTFLGGSGTDAGHAIAVDSNGNAYVTGVTQSTDFPVFSWYQQFLGLGGHNAFVTKLDQNGQLGVPGTFAYSTYLGGSKTDEGNGIAVDSSGNAYVTGFTTSSDFPITVNNYLIGKLRGSQSAFITMVDHTGSTLDFSTYIGGTASDTGTAIALDSSANCYITGNTSSSDFPTVNVISGQSKLLGSQAAFVAKINPINPVFIFSSYLGGHYTTSGSGIAVDSNRNAYVTGQTSSPDFPTANPFQIQYGGSSDAFVSAVNGLTLPLINVSPKSLSFPDTAVGSTSTLPVTVSNAGDATLTFTSITATTSSSSTSEFSADTSACGQSLAPAATCTVNVTFSPAASGFQSGALTFTDNAAFSPQQMSLSGNGTQPTISISPTSLAFGNQGIATTSPAQNVTVTNTGSAPLVITSIVAAPSDYAVSNNTCPSSPSSLAAQSNCVVSVTFTPSASNSILGTLAITDNAPGSPQALALSGTGVVAFGLSAPNGQSQTINRGTNTATFLIQAGSPFNFTGPIALACHGTGLVTCSFNPTSIYSGQQSILTLSNFTSLPSDTLTFGVTGTNGNQVFQLGLQVLIPDFGLAVSPTSETVNAGQTASYTLTFVPVNNFTDPVTFTCLGVPATITCTVNPSSVTSDGTSTLALLLTLGTTARTSAGPRIGPKVIVPPLGQPARPHWLLWLLAFFMVTTLAAAQRRRARPDRVGARLGFALTALFVLLWAACTVSTTTSTGTPAGDYGIVVEGATNGGTVKHDSALRLIVN